MERSRSSVGRAQHFKQKNKSAQSEKIDVEPS